MERIREPRELVAELHRRIAAKSPEHAELVARFEVLPSRVPAGDGRQAGGQARGEQISATFRGKLRTYLALRADGLDRELAAAALGIHPKTAQRYDSESYLAQDLGPEEASRT